MPATIRPDQAIGWLQVLAEQDGGSVRAALLLTSPRGVPARFHFVRASFEDDGASRGGEILCELCAALLRAASSPPALLLGQIDVALPRQVREKLVLPAPFIRVEVPAVCLGPSEPMLLWVPGEGADASVAVNDFLAQAARGDEALSPIERSRKALQGAFQDRHVADATRLADVMAVFTLTRPARLSPTTTSAPPRTEDESEPSFAERLWALLEPVVAPLSAVTLDWNGTLMPFQTDGVRTLLRMDQLLLADDMGLGKTIQAIAATRILMAGGQAQSCLVVAPAGLLDQWRRELTRWAPELSAIIVRGAANERAWQWAADKDVTLASFGVLRSDRRHVAQRAGRPWDVVIVDEAQRIKNRNDTSAAVKAISRVRSWALTGTPVENNEDELASIIEFVDHSPGVPRRRYRPGTELLDRHRELQLRRRKQDVLPDLPPKLETKCAIDLLPSQRASYDRAENDGVAYLRSLGAEVRIRHVLELITRLKQICNADPRTGASGKLDDIRERLTELTARGHKALVFSQYVNDVSGVAWVAARLREFNPLTLTGKTPLDERTALVDRFKRSTDNGLLVVSLRAGGVGLNLQEASYVFHLDRWWNPAVETQAEDRSHRLGQSVKVHVFKYTCRDTIEERIEAILERKRELFARLVDDVSLDLSTELTRDELLGLFGLGP